MLDGREAELRDLLLPSEEGKIVKVSNEDLFRPSSIATPSELRQILATLEKVLGNGNSETVHGGRSGFSHRRRILGQEMEWRVYLSIILYLSDPLIGVSGDHAFFSYFPFYLILVFVPKTNGGRKTNPRERENCGVDDDDDDDDDDLFPKTMNMLKTSSL
ncbi:hypothetical protein KC321_g33 [Hortaea werneckii]|nr:hypothetical protein KC321_g33 [Hortaea werneckii]